MIIENPTNACENSNKCNYNGYNLKTTVANAKINRYELVKWYEIVPTSDWPKSTTSF